MTALCRDGPPLRAGAASFDLDEALGSHLPQDVTNHVAADTRTILLEILIKA
jgi:hypothetical protein